ncbi:CBS domain-containing protein CBSCBSPB1-like protein [Tanacetum coccineum]|uniref:CBS domain-containing protein CBSCBSPB1-like protein n=1 Tax=Tanacetum coccineum TaxID=301880 RepID=A0ABQ5HAE4_9ASTR
MSRLGAEGIEGSKRLLCGILTHQDTTTRVVACELDIENNPISAVNSDTCLLSKMKMLWLFLTYNFLYDVITRMERAYEKAKAITAVVEGAENHWGTSANPFDF